MKRDFPEGSIQWAMEILGPIRSGIVKNRSPYSSYPYWLDGKRVTRDAVVAEARKRAENRKCNGMS